MGRHLRSGLLALAVLIAGWSLGADGQERTVPRSGGILKVALNAEPPSLDLQWSTALATQQIGWHLYETLYTLDRDYNPIPLLAEGHTVSDEGPALHHHAPPRRAVPRRARDDLRGRRRIAPAVGACVDHRQAVWSSVVSVDPSGPYAVTLSLKEASHSLVSALARPTNAAAIHPKEVIAAAGAGQIREFIGTRPVSASSSTGPTATPAIARFDGYAAPRPSTPDGYGGRAHRVPSTRSCSSPCPTRPCAWPASRRASLPLRATRVAPGSVLRPRASRSAEALDARVVKPAIRLNRGGPQPSSQGHDDFQEDPPGLPGRAGHGAGHGRRASATRSLLPPGRRPVLPRSTPLWHSTAGLAAYGQKSRGTRRASSCARPATGASPSAG